jgi:ribose 5-phosphate isomerase RpiB
MRIAVVSETSAGDKNPHIVKALEGREHEIFNIGMKKTGEKPELTYIHTGLLAAIALNLKRVDFVVGGCGTGQGFLNSVMQYPGVFCGLILDSLDVWLFTQINGGNCISLALNKGFGWAADVNLQFIFDRIFSVERGAGYPPHRKESQTASRLTLESISMDVHKPFADIIRTLSDGVIMPVLEYPGVRDFIDMDRIDDDGLRAAFRERMG